MVSHAPCSLPQPVHSGRNTPYKSSVSYFNLFGGGHVEFFFVWCWEECRCGSVYDSSLCCWDIVVESGAKLV